ncbi:hypothetical protein C8A01DRAFT_31233 [Parachaetomium inaequale]|uniref:Uncharacterized protein n=1 Tax=Parachaetomium inaequale TaxID=2588326 RepID=A0AAN6SWE1_9PEZI|nr:hypothetical protein C8A01DRAFT_31233 [Parachaetomium inaequale]
MDPIAERILISVGSIGGFILVCFIAWMVWRTTKKSRRDGYASGGAGGFPRRVASKIPFFRRRGWQNLDDPTVSRSPPPSYREKTGGARAPSVAGFYGSEKMQVQQPPQQPWPQSTPEVVVLPGHGSMQPGIMYQPPPNPRNTYTTADRPHITLMTNIPAAYSHQAQGSFSSTNAAHFGAIMTPDNTASPIHSGVSPASYYNQPLLNQQFTTPYNPLYRQPSRTISEVSSLSSGFGDGDIIVTDPLIAPPAPTAAPGSSATNSPQQQHQYTTRFSWMSQPQGGGGPAPQPPPPPPAGQTTPPTRQNSNASTNTSGNGGRRETVYTETSEDQPARFRSVTSWVDQQTGRIRRVQQRGAAAAAGGGGDSTTQGGQQARVQVQVPGNPGIPGIHNPPREQSFGMMMDDEERPRRVEEVVELGRVG